MADTPDPNDRATFEEFAAAMVAAGHRRPSHGIFGFDSDADEYKFWGWAAGRMAALAVKEAPSQWEPEFDVMAPEQERLVLEFCLEIAGLKGERGSPPDPVRLLEMAQALYKAERDAFAPAANIQQSKTVAPPVVKESLIADPWREAVIDALYCAHIYRAEHDADPAKAINELLCWEAKIALDPAVSAEARKLQDDARAYPAAVPRGVLEAWERFNVWWQDMLDNRMDDATLGKAGYAAWKGMDAAVKGAPAEPAPAQTAEPMEMCLCESRSVVLRLGQPYIFKEMEGCEACKAMGDQAREAYGPCGGASWVGPALQRQPLSGEALRDIARSFSGKGLGKMQVYWPVFTEFARAIEAAHGIGAAPAGPAGDFWYLQDTRTLVGNNVVWWAKGTLGYSTDLRNAEVFSRANAHSMEAARGCYQAWPKAYIDGKSRPAVDFQHIDHAEALAAAPAAQPPKES